MSVDIDRINKRYKAEQEARKAKDTDKDNLHHFLSAKQKNIILVVFFVVMVAIVGVGVPFLVKATTHFGDTGNNTSKKWDNGTSPLDKNGIDNTAHDTHTNSKNTYKISLEKYVSEVDE